MFDLSRLAFARVHEPLCNENVMVAFEKGIFAIIRSLMYLDGMVLRCKPDAVLLRDMRRFIGEFEKLV